MAAVKWIVFILGGLAFLVTAVFSVMLILQPPKKPIPKKVKGKSVASSKVTKSDKLKMEIDKYQQMLKKQKVTIDSLEQIAQVKTKLEQEVERLNTLLKGKSDKEARAKEIAKTLSSMKTKAMAPILQKLDDDTIILIYQQTGKTARKDILLALSESRAAKIANKLINSN